MGQAGGAVVKPGNFLKHACMVAVWAAGCGQSHDHAPPLGAGGGASGDKACWDKPSFESCLPCCESEHPDGAEAYVNAMKPCVCEPAHCGAACAQSLCAEPIGYLDDACATCMTNALLSGGECESAFNATCAADPVCKGLDQCSSGCH